MAICLSDINLTADNWLYPRLLSRQIKIKDTIHCTMISDSKAIHAQFLSLGNKFWNTAHAIEQAVLCMNMEVGKFLRHFLKLYHEVFNLAFLCLQDLR